MSDLLQTIVDGIADGSVYGAIALALALIYRSTGVINFAQGSMAMLATFGAWALIQAGAGLALAILLAVVLAGVSGMALERVVIRRVEHRDELSVVIVTVGLTVFFDSLAVLIWGGDNRNFPSLFGDGVLTVGGARLGVAELGTAGLLLAVVGAVWLLLERTELGLSMRASAVDAHVARLLGVRVDRTLMLGWGLAAAIGALAGALIAPRLFLDVTFMSGVLIYGLAAACLGGFDSPVGAVLGGWIVGLAESLTTGYLDFIGSDLRVLVPFTVIVVVLLIRPNGLFGSREVVRV